MIAKPRHAKFAFPGLFFVKMQPSNRGMAATDEQLATLSRLRKMRDSGITSTTVDGVSTTFQSLDALRFAIVNLEREAGLRAPRVRCRSVFMGHR